MKNSLKTGLCAIALSFGAASAHAATMNTVVAECDPGNAFFNGSVQCGAGARSDVSNVNLGAPDGKFYSLGLNANSDFGGMAAFEINPAFTGPSMIVEVTNPNTTHWEAADVYVATGFDGMSFMNQTLVGRVNNGKGGTEAAATSVNFAGLYSYLIFQDASFAEYGRAGNGTNDGFDLDSFTVAAVPLPAGAVLLGGALFGMGAMRRRKAAA